MEKYEKRLKLLPSLREDKRYLALILKRKFDVKKQIENAVLKFLGLLGYAKAGLIVIETGNKNKKNYAIISVNRNSVNDLKSSLLLKDIKCIGISGTIKGLRRFLNALS